MGFARICRVKNRTFSAKIRIPLLLFFFAFVLPVFSVSFIHLSLISKSSFVVTSNDFSPCLFAYYYISLSMVYLDLVFIFSRNCSVFSATLRCYT